MTRVLERASSVLLECTQTRCMVSEDEGSATRARGDEEAGEREHKSKAGAGSSALGSGGATRSEQRRMSRDSRERGETEVAGVCRRRRLGGSADWPRVSVGRWPFPTLSRSLRSALCIAARFTLHLDPMADLASSQALSDAAHGATNTTEVLYLVARHFISSFIDLLHSSVTTDAQLTYTSKLSSGSSIGKHARHLADHYRLLFEGTARSRGAGSESPLEVNYDQRTRNLAAETSHAACVDAFEQLRAQLATVTGEGKAVDAAREVRLHATTPFEVDVASSFGRELWFASFHAGASSLGRRCRRRGRC